MFHDHFDATYEVQTGTALRLFQPTKNAAAGKFLLLRESFLIQ